MPRTIIPTADPAPYLEAGKQLKAVRWRMRLSTRDVERLSEGIASEKKNQEYYLSHAWLADIENGRFMPGVCKLYSLSLIYKRSLDAILAFFGIHVREAGREQMSVGLPHTQLVETNLDNDGGSITLPLALREKVLFERTNLVSRMFERWGEIPVVLLRQMDLRSSLYGYIGMEDYTLYPIIRPGSFVQIDARQKRIRPVSWRNEFDRPIYFVELRDSYACSWCELSDNQLSLVPYSQLREPVRRVRYPLDAEIVGRVTAVVMHIAEPLESRG